MNWEKIRRTSHFIGLSVFLVSLLFFNFVSAAPLAQASENVAVLFIIDNSGSMAENDPGGLRFTAAKLFISLMDEGDMAGALLFSSSAQPLTDGIIEIKGEAERQVLIDAIEKRPGDGWTDVRTAFAAANEMLSASSLGSRETIVVFLTDGEPAIEKEYAAFEQEALDEAQKLGVPVKSIALTKAAESPFLVRLVSQTNGSIESAVNANQLLDAFLNILGGLKDRAVIGSGAINAPGSASVEISQTLAPYIDSVSYVITKTSKITARLLNPNAVEVNQNSSGVTQYIQEDDFLVVRSGSIQPGKWQFDLSGSGSVQARAIVNSRLRTSVITPGALYEQGTPMPVVVNLFEEQENGERVKIIGEASFSALITKPDGSQESLDTFYDDGTNGDAQAGDGDFSRLYVNNESAGSYLIEVIGRKGDVPVTAKSQVLMVPFPKINITEPSALSYDFKGQSIPLEIRLNGTASPQLDSGGMQALVTSPSGKASVLPMTASGNQYYASLSPTEEGEYTLVFRGANASYQGMPYTTTAEKTISVRLIPQVNLFFENGQKDRLDLGKLELGENNTIAIRLTAESSASQPIQVNVRLQGLSGWEIAGDESLSIQPGENRLLILQLEPVSGLGSTKFEGQLVFSSSSQVDVEPGALDIQFEFIQPAVSFLGIPLELSFPSSCFSRKGMLEIDVASNLVGGETLYFEIIDSDRLSIDVPEQRIRPGANHLFLPVGSKRFLWKPDELEFNLSVLNPRQGLAILPQNKIPVVLRVVPVWSSCSRQIKSGGLLIGGLLVLFLIARAVIRSRVGIPPVEGILNYKKQGESLWGPAFVISGLNKQRIRVGSGASCDLLISDGELMDVQFEIYTKKDSGDTLTYINPIGSVRMGYSDLPAETELNSGTEFSAGKYRFRYDSASGY